jgi:hypothetical protein
VNEHTDLSPEQILQEQDSIARAYTEMLDMPGAGIGGDTDRGRKAIELVNRQARLEQARAAQGPAPTLDSLEQKYAERTRRTALQQRIAGALADAPLGSDASAAVVDDMLALSATDPAVAAEAGPSFTWSDYRRVASGENGLSQGLQDRFERIFRESGLESWEAARLATMWAEAPTASDADLRALWGPDHDPNVAHVQNLLLDQLPRSTGEWLISQGLRRRPAFLEELVRIGKARGGR